MRKRGRLLADDFGIVGDNFECKQLEVISRSRKATAHELYIDKSTGQVFCSCEDSSCREKHGHLLAPFSKSCCWHTQQFFEILTANAGYPVQRQSL